MAINKACSLQNLRGPVSQKVWHNKVLSLLKGYLISQNSLKKILLNKTMNLQRNNYEVCIAIARCFPNILDIMVLENINLSL
jgi:hypothetical protein